MSEMTTVDHPVMRFTGTTTVEVLLTVHARCPDGHTYKRDLTDQDDIDHAMALVSAWAASHADKPHTIAA